MRCIINEVTDHTNVYGYIHVDVLDEDGMSVDPEIQERAVGREVMDLTREQYPSTGHIRKRDIEEVAALLRERGHDVVVHA